MLETMAHLATIGMLAIAIYGSLPPPKKKSDGEEPVKKP